MNITIYSYNIVNIYLAVIIKVKTSYKNKVIKRGTKYYK